MITESYVRDHFENFSEASVFPLCAFCFIHIFFFFLLLCREAVKYVKCKNIFSPGPFIYFSGYTRSKWLLQKQQRRKSIKNTKRGREQTFTVQAQTVLTLWGAQDGDHFSTSKAFSSPRTFEGMELSSPCEAKVLSP